MSRVTHTRIRKSKDGQFFTVAYGANNEPLWTTELFTEKHNAVKAAHDFPVPCDVDTTGEPSEPPFLSKMEVDLENEEDTIIPGDDE
jgi:uncharacterized protein YegP (UPF0339 family)